MRTVCLGNIEGCEAEEVLCPLCGPVMACSEHGHVAEWQLAREMRPTVEKVIDVDRQGC